MPAQPTAREDRLITSDAARRLLAWLRHADTAFALVEASGRVRRMSPAVLKLVAHASDGAAPAKTGMVAELQQLGRAAAGRSPSRFSVHGLGPTLQVMALSLPRAGALLIVQPRERSAGLGALTRREAEILGWLGEGKTNSEIARVLGVSPRTVEKHCGNLFAKLGVENRLGAALLARGELPAPKVRSG